MYKKPSGKGISISKVNVKDKEQNKHKIVSNTEDKVVKGQELGNRSKKHGKKKYTILTRKGTWITHLHIHSKEKRTSDPYTRDKRLNLRIYIYNKKKLSWGGFQVVIIERDGK